MDRMMNISLILIGVHTLVVFGLVVIGIIA